MGTTATRCTTHRCAQQPAVALPLVRGTPIQNGFCNTNYTGRLIAQSLTMIDLYVLYYHSQGHTIHHKLYLANHFSLQNSIDTTPRILSIGIRHLIKAPESINIENKSFLLMFVEEIYFDSTIFDFIPQKNWEQLAQDAL